MQRRLKVDKIILLEYVDEKDFFDPNLIKIKEFGIMCGDETYIFKKDLKINKSKWKHFRKDDNNELIIEGDIMSINSPQFNEIISMPEYKTDVSELVEKMI